MASDSELHPVVAADRQLFRACFGAGSPGTIGELLDAMVDAVGDAIPAGDPAAVAYFTNWHPDYLGASSASITGSAPDRPDVRLAVARGHGFTDWHASQASRDVRFDPQFEAAADAVVGGHAEPLADLVAARPSLVGERSRLGHSATLLHYVAANGVEFRRQESGPRAPAIAEQLLSAGAAIDALANTYGGGTSQTVLVLLLTSGHPANAGVTNPVLDVLLRHGADPNGVNGDGAPLRAARRVGNDGAVARLTAAGADDK
jgi:hypothetical protein